MPESGIGLIPDVGGTWLLGRAPGVENLFLANGSSGHGVMHSPALGHLLAEIILDGRQGRLGLGSLLPLSRSRSSSPRGSSGSGSGLPVSTASSWRAWR